jgi:hypothetical protein
MVKVLDEKTRPAKLLALFRGKISLLLLPVEEGVYTYDTVFSFMESTISGGDDKILMRQILFVLMLVSMQYTVNTGDSLQSIAEQYCPGDDPRQIAEFREGLRELNYDSIGENDVSTGVKLQINLWE